VDQVSLDRCAVVRTLLSSRGDTLVVAGLGSAAWDVAAAGDDNRNFYMWGGMGGAAMIGLGLALAQPGRRVLVVTGDGELLMGLGSLATIALKRPRNLAIVVLDNGMFGETGMQPSHTSGPTSLSGVARACGVPVVFDVEREAEIAPLVHALAESNNLLFARVRVATDELPRVLPERDGQVLKARFRAATGV
jgi:thiamine pyrophosphate-dependent acetolactate synthase large subunit-like protein